MQTSNITVRRFDGVARLRRPTWNRLVEGSRTPSVFLRSGFLLAVAAAYHDNQGIVVLEAHRNNQPVAGLVVVKTGTHRWEALGNGVSDYIDVLVDRTLDADDAERAIAGVVEAALTHPLDRLIVRGVPVESGSVASLARLGFYPVETRTVPAPTMDRDAFATAARKKSLRRHTNRLAREGALRFCCLTTADEIEAALPAFFAQHVARWASTDTPSMFSQPSHRQFYRELVQRLARSNVVRFHQVWLDDTLVASHLGFVDARRFTWYKPAFDPNWSSHSPGEVLLRRLIEDAVEEPVDEFDFTVGDESFKFRFATRVRTVVDVWIASRAWMAGAKKAQLVAKREMKEALPAHTWRRAQKLLR